MHVRYLLLCMFGRYAKYSGHDLTTYLFLSATKIPTSPPTYAPVTPQPVSCPGVGVSCGSPSDCCSGLSCSGGKPSTRTCFSDAPIQRPALRLGEVVVVEARMILVALLLIAVAITVRVEVAKGAVYDTKKVKLKSLKDGKWFGISEVYAIYTRDK